LFGKKLEAVLQYLIGRFFKQAAYYTLFVVKHGVVAFDIKKHTRRYSKRHKAY
jgi:hypothetical protein